MIILGISAFFHDSAAALVVDGKVSGAAAEERFTRQKHDSEFPTCAVAFVLEQAGLTTDDVDKIVFYEDPLKKFERILVNQVRQFPRGLSQFTRAMGTWLGRRLWLKAEIAERLDVDSSKISFCEHHLSHAASVFLTHPCDDAAVVTVDGVGEWATTTIFHGKRSATSVSLEPLCELHFPHSIGLLYSAVTAFLGFEVNNGEYKVMGLAPYGTPRFVDVLHEMASIGDDGSLTLDLSFFAFQHHATKSFSAKLEARLGPARVPGAPLSLGTNEVDDESQRFADIASSLQVFTETYLEALVRHAQELTGAKTLCLAGGVALNSVANHKIAQSGLYDVIHTHPAAGDAGGALGAALYESHVVEGETAGQAAPAFNIGTGEAFSQESVQTFLTACRVPHRTFSDDTSDLYATIADKLSNGDVGGFFEGGFEWGPRALGHRSILADPRRENARDRVNASIKFREAFRPFAPSVLKEEESTWFSAPPMTDDSSLRQTMSTVALATEKARMELPSVVHVDGTSRIQTVDEESDPVFHRVLEAFKARTGVGVLLNTSMNLRGEPICHSPADAYGMFLRSGLDFLVVQGCLIERSA